jgi:hypothetical protein
MLVLDISRSASAWGHTELAPSILVGEGSSSISPSLSLSGCIKALARTFAGRAKFAYLFCREGTLELTEFFSSALYLMGGLADPRLCASNEGLLIPQLPQRE